VFDSNAKQFNVTWKGIEHALSYTLQATDNDIFETIYEGPNTSFVFPCVQNTILKFRVCASNGISNGAWSNVVVASTSCKVFIIASTQGHAQDIASLLQKEGFAQNDLVAFDASTGTPLLTDLTQCNVVLIHSWFNMQSPQNMGDILAQYVEQGGRLIVSGFTSWNANSMTTHLSGNFLTKNYHPYQVATTYSGQIPCQLGTVLVPNHPLFTGIKTVDGGSYSGHVHVTLQHGAVNLANWTDNYSFAAELKLAHLQNPILALNFDCPSSTANATTFWIDSATNDARKLLRNAVIYAATGSAPSDSSALNDDDIDEDEMAE